MVKNIIFFVIKLNVQFLDEHFFRIFLALSNTNNLNIECKLWKWSAWTRRSNGKYEATNSHIILMIFAFLLVIHFTNKSLRLNKRGNKFRTLLYNSCNVQIIHGYAYFIRVGMHVRLWNFKQLPEPGTCKYIQFRKWVGKNLRKNYLYYFACAGWGWGGRGALRALFHENNSSRRKNINLMMLTWVIKKLIILLIFCFYKEYGSFAEKAQYHNDMDAVTYSVMVMHRPRGFFWVFWIP